MKKMPSAATIAVFLLSCFSIASTGSQADCDVYAATGSSFTVRLKHVLKDSDSLRWFKNENLIFHRRSKKVIIGKNDDVDSTGSLKLTQLTKNNTGRYAPQIHRADGTSAGDLPSVRLCVLDRVQKPNVTMTCTDKGHVNFTCSVGQNEKITWFMDDEALEEKEKTLTREIKDVLKARFSCNVSNSVSSEISLPVQQNCYATLQKPHVTVNCTGDSEVTFTCAVSQKDNYVEFKWFNKENKQQESGETLTKKTKDVVNTRFFCNVSNPISYHISDPAVQNCFKPSFPTELLGISIWVFIGGGAGMFHVLCSRQIICSYSEKHTKTMNSLFFSMYNTICCYSPSGLLILVIVTATVCCVRARRKRRI
uniref:T-cell surface antigen CD2 n=1 Tax=Oreochromis niloticus TaxID=8128 RepID=A0A669BDS8_ORENI